MSDPAPDPRATGSGPQSNLILRTVSALVLAPIAIWCVWTGELWFVVLVAIVAAACGGEWRRMSGLDRYGIGPVLIIGPLFVVLAGQAVVPAAGFVAAIVAIVVTLGAYTTPWPERRWTALGLAYVAIGSVAILQLREWPDTGRELALFLLAAVWLSDIGGYVVGRLVGGSKLAPRVSPGKTWSGAFGSVAFAAAGGAVFAIFAGSDAIPVMSVAALLSVAAQFGDLFESWIKRVFGVKDSGASIPGHGGMLDRVDGVLFAAPALVIIVIVSGAEFVQWQ